MRFFISSKVKKNKPLYYAILFFLAFALLFWIASWIHFYTKYGFSQETLANYFFIDVELPEKIDIGQISEDLHTGLFLHGMMLIVLFSLLNITWWSNGIKITLIFSASFLAIFYLFSDFLIFSPRFVLLKLIAFVLYQAAYLFLLVLSLIGIILERDRHDKGIGMLKLIVFLFSLFSLFFIFSTFLNFYAKMGLSPQGIRDYFLGNEELFIKRKSFDGVFKVFYPHILSMAIYSLTITHLLPFAGLSKRASLSLGMSIFLFSFLDNLSSLMILYLDSFFVYVKMLSFWLFQACSLLASLLILRASLSKASYPSLYI